MLNFASDYTHAAHPLCLDALARLAGEPNPGYGTDPHTQRAADLIRDHFNIPDATIHFLAGGTQTNLFWASLLNPWEGILAARTGHIATHEAGAIEHTGHKVIELPHTHGKLDIDAAATWLNTFHNDPNNPHMVHPGGIYISQPTEYGSVYTPDELHRLRTLADTHNLKLYIDGARLAYAPETPVTLADAFTIGGTKCGTLLGEALVFPNPATTPTHLVPRIKQHGALLAKGFIVGAQFEALLPHYFDLGRTAVAHADRIRTHTRYETVGASTTNQIFLRMPRPDYEHLTQHIAMSFWEEDPTGVTVRLATSWATTTSDVDALLPLIS